MMSEEAVLTAEECHYLSTAYHNDSDNFCPTQFDGVLCWPKTNSEEIALLPCFGHFQGVSYNTSGTATRHCDLNGIWSKSNYTNCQSLPPPLLTIPYPPNSEGGVSDVSVTSQFHLDITVGIYAFGYCLSLVALLVAAAIFCMFKELRCLRNRIHSHLIATYILSDGLWVAIASLLITDKSGHQTSCAGFILFHYFHLTNFFWMLVEGLYLYVLVVQTFMAESIKFRIYCLIGWGCPFLIVSSWTIIKWVTAPDGILQNTTSVTLLQFNSTLPYHLTTQLADPDLTTACPWLHETMYDWIFKAGALFVLAANTLFLCQIMWVLITKLRSMTAATASTSTSPFNPEALQSRKAAKALVVLMPLLGITYVLVLIGPSKSPAYEHTRAFLISTQGFLVALLYCFLNAEVRLQVRMRWNRIRNMGFSAALESCWGSITACCGCEVSHGMHQSRMQGREWSPRSRTESLRLFGTPTTLRMHAFRKRESSASETTTMTTLMGSLNGSGTVPNAQSRKLQSTEETPVHVPSVVSLKGANDQSVLV